MQEHGLFWGLTVENTRESTDTEVVDWQVLHVTRGTGGMLQKRHSRFPGRPEIAREEGDHRWKD